LLSACHSIWQLLYVSPYFPPVQVKGKPLIFDFRLRFLRGAVYLLKSGVIVLWLSDRSLDRLL
ncbi:MAG: hypothetical protein WBG61_13320, partial [Desulfobacterales bacterium]